MFDAAVIFGATSWLDSDEGRAAVKAQAAEMQRADAALTIEQREARERMFRELSKSSPPRPEYQDSYLWPALVGFLFGAWLL